MIEAVIFDIDGVLLDSKAANIAWYRRFLEEHGFPPVSEAELEYGHIHTLRESIAHLTGAPDNVVDELWEQARDLAGYPYELAGQPEGCSQVLQRLSRDYALGVMSSRIVEGIRQYLDVSGLHDLFSALVGYEDTARHKPDPEPLLVACERLGVSPQAAVYVGDAVSDMECARAAGTHFVAFGGGVPGAEIGILCFDDLETTIREIAR